MTAAAAAVADAHRREWARVLAATVRVTRDLDLAEECVQDAYARALSTWAETGIPVRPAAWLTTAARNRALALLRRDALFRRAMPELVMDEVEPPPEPDTGEILDDRLRLICTCCHPALGREAQVGQDVVQPVRQRRAVEKNLPPHRRQLLVRGRHRSAAPEHRAGREQGETHHAHRSTPFWFWAEHAMPLRLPPLDE